MTKPFHSILSFEDSDFEDRIKALQIYKIFEPLLSLDYIDMTTFRQLVKYILLAYSIDSDSIIIGQEWLQNKKDIYRKVGLTDNEVVVASVLYLKDPTVVSVIKEWLDFGDDDGFKELQVLKDLRVEMQISCLTAIRKPSMELDYDQKFRNAEYSKKLLEMIKEVEAGLLQNNVKMREAVGEVRKQHKKNTMSASKAFA